jgi:hypothetical protein
MGIYKIVINWDDIPYAKPPIGDLDGGLLKARKF